MRRKEREVTDKNQIEEIIRSCHVCRIGLADEERVYIVPMNFGYVNEAGKHVFYFHSGKEGRKIDLIHKSAEAGFEMDTDYELKTAQAACGYTAYYRSIIGHGTVQIVEDDEEKKRGLLALMRHQTGRDGWEFPDKMVNAVSILKLTADELTAKENRKSEE